MAPDGSNIFAEIQRRTHKPFLVCWVAAPPEAVKALRALGIAVFSAGERAVEAAAALAAYARWNAGDHGREAAGVSHSAVPDSFEPGVQGTVEVSALLRAGGIPMAGAALADTADRAVELWRERGGPVALKIESPDILHKTEIGGVLLGVDGEDAIRRGFHTLCERAGSKPGARISGVIVQEMSSGHVELVVGVQRDPVFGMIVMAGTGGIFVEVLKDVTFRRAPFGISEAHTMLDELRMGSLLDGVRGKPAVDRGRIAEMLSQLSVWADMMSPVLSELDLNPVLVGQNGPVAVDCVMIFEKDAPRLEAAG